MLPMRQMRKHLPGVAVHGLSATGDYADGQAGIETGDHDGKLHLVLPHLLGLFGTCPREIEIPAVMEAIRHMAIEQNYINDSTKVKEIRTFHKIFLDMIKRYGRNYELRMMAEFNIRTRNLFKDMHLAPKALLKGKIPLGVKSVKSAKAIQRMFKLAEKLEKKHL